MTLVLMRKENKGRREVYPEHGRRESPRPCSKKPFISERLFGLYG